LNHFAADLGIPSESDLLRIGISYKGAIQMAFAMPKLKRLKSGAFSARKVIPKDVRDEYCARFRGGWEERFYVEAGTSVGEAKRALNDWLAEIERRISAIRG
jgi:hypothetical protein